MGAAPLDHPLRARRAGSVAAVHGLDLDVGRAVLAAAPPPGLIGPEEAEKAGLDADAKGLIVTKVETDSKAYRWGLRVGAVIVQVNRRDVETPKDFRKALDEGKKLRSVLLRIRTAQGSRLLTIPKD